MNVIKKLMRTLYILSKMRRYLYDYPILIIFPLLATLFYFIFETLLFALFYLKYGAVVFNPFTIQHWGMATLWDISIIVVFFVGPTYFIANSVKLFCKGATLHYIASCLDNKAHSFINSIKASYTHAVTLIHFSYVSTLMIFIAEPGLKKFLRNQARLGGAGKFVKDSEGSNWNEQSFLVMPYIMLDNLSLPDAIEKSDQTMEQLYGKGNYAQCSFFNLVLAIMFLLAAPLGFVLSYYFPVVGIAVFFGITTVALCFLSCAEGIYQTIVYNFYHHKKIDPYSQLDVQESFKQE